MATSETTPDSPLEPLSLYPYRRFSPLRKPPPHRFSLTPEKTNSSEKMKALATSIWDNDVVRKEILSYLQEQSLTLRWIDSRACRDMLMFNVIDLPPARLSSVEEVYIAVSAANIGRRTGGHCPEYRSSIYQKSVRSIHLIISQPISPSDTFKRFNWKAYLHTYPNLSNIRISLGPENEVFHVMGQFYDDKGGTVWMSEPPECPTWDEAFIASNPSNIHQTYRLEGVAESEQPFPLFWLRSIKYDAGNQTGFRDQKESGEHLCRFVDDVHYIKTPDQSLEDVMEDLESGPPIGVKFDWYEATMMERLGRRFPYLSFVDISSVPLTYLICREVLDELIKWWKELYVFKLTLTLDLRNDTQHFPEDFAGPPDKLLYNFDKTRYDWLAVDSLTPSDIRITHIPTTDPFDWKLFCNLMHNWFGPWFDNDSCLCAGMLGTEICDCPHEHLDWDDEEVDELMCRWQKVYEAARCKSFEKDDGGE